MQAYPELNRMFQLLVIAGYVIVPVWNEFRLDRFIADKYCSLCHKRSLLNLFHSFRMMRSRLCLKRFLLLRVLFNQRIDLIINQGYQQA
jgi:hypothetical protein